MVDNFREWLAQELEKRHWSHRELARRTGFSQATVSKTLSGERNASADFCVKVADVLGEVPEKILRLAGILHAAQVSDDDPILSEAIDMLRNLPHSQVKQALKYLHFLNQNGPDEN